VAAAQLNRLYNVRFNLCSILDSPCLMNKEPRRAKY
jgi:hypothetical protein